MQFIKQLHVHKSEPSHFGSAVSYVSKTPSQYVNSTTLQYAVRVPGAKFDCNKYS